MQSTAAQLRTDLFPDAPKSDARRGAFTDNMKLPVHRWFRYSAGFSAEWCGSILENEPNVSTVLDPFGGSGTTLLAAQQCKLKSYGFEPHDFVFRVAQAKLAWRSRPNEFVEDATAVLLEAQKADGSECEVASPLLSKCFSPQALCELVSLRQAFERHWFKSEDSRSLTWLALTSILRETSSVGTAQWQYVLPNKTKAKVKRPFSAFAEKADLMKSDMQMFSGDTSTSATMLAHDARMVHPSIGEGEVDVVVTSPPYPNNYDYADATRLEMSFWGELSSWSELHSTVRRHLITSCSQHSAAERLQLDEVLSSALLEPIRVDLTNVCRDLQALRAIKPGKKSYDTMVAAYFRDLAQIWHTLRYHVRRGGNCYFVIGDSAPYGVYVPVDKWLGTLAEAAGFSSWSFEKFRDRNTKWKNRKHTVPLKEGVLRVQG